MTEVLQSEALPNTCVTRLAELGWILLELWGKCILSLALGFLQQIT